MPKGKVLVTPASFFEAGPEPAQVLLDAGLEVVDRRRVKKYAEADMVELIAGMDAMVAGSEPMTARVMDASAGLRIIARFGVGYDAIDTAAARQRRIAVTTVPGTLEESVADYALGLMLAVLRGIPQADATTRVGKWERPLSTDAFGKTLGIIGAGRIGRAVARRAAAFGMSILAYDVYPDHPWAAAAGARFVDLPQLLKASDVITLHAPGTPQTYHLINEKTLALMQPSAFLVNTARGTLVDEQALYAALSSGRLAGAALDVFEKEPTAPNPLLGLPNVVVTSHVASATVEAARRMGVLAAQEVVRVLSGETPLHLVPELR